MKRLPKIILTLTAALMISCLIQTSSFAQTITATLTGEVKDQAGAVVPGATVTATSLDTGQAKTATTGDSGNYTIPFLPPGTYNVTVSKSGFGDTTREKIRLEIAQTAAIDITLGVTAGTVNVSVDSNETPILQTETSNLETTIEQKLIEDLPTADRNIFNFVNLVPGTIDGGTAAGNPNGAVGSASNRNFFDSNFSVSGGRASSNDILLDGVTNTIGDFGGVAISPPQDSIREFKVISGVAPAEYGRTAGGIVTIVSKAGGNKFHGALYEYFQDRELNANGFFRNRNPATARRINVNRSQFGGAISGPVFLPAFNEGGPVLYNGKKKTFFFFNYEARREDNPFTRELLTVPTAAQRTGNLADLLGGNRADVLFGANNPGGASGTPVRFGQIFNPFGALVNYISVNPTTGVQTIVQGRPIFANNDLSGLPSCTSATRTSACLDPVARAVLGYIPLPNATGTVLPNTPGVINNFAINDTSKFTRDIFAGRIDQRISDKQSFFGRFSYESRRDAQPNYFNSAASNARTIHDTFGNFTLNHVYSFTPTVINNARYGYTRVRANQIPNGNGFDATTLGLPSYLRDGAANLQFPDFTIGGGADGLTVPGQINSATIGGAGNNQPRDVHTLADAVTIVRGSHTVKTGGEFRLYRFYPFQYFTPQGSFSFDRTFTRGPIAPSGLAETVSGSGSALASFLLGLPSSGNREAVTALSIYKKYGAGFVQDDWKVRPNLTLNLGVRYEIETGTGEANQLVTNFDVGTASPINGQTRAVTDAFVTRLNPNVGTIRGLLSYPKGGQTKANRKQFAPRVGFAYSFDEKTTVRGGYGLFYLPQSLEGTSAAGTNFTTNLVQSSPTAQVTSSTVTLLNPFPNGIQGVTGNTLGALTQLGGAVTAVAPKRPTSYNQQFNLVIQRQLAKNLVLDIAYVGSRGVRLPVQSVNLNQLPFEDIAFARDNFATAGTCPTTANAAAACTSAAQFLSFQVANPFQGLIPAVGGLNGATIARAQLLRPFPQYQTVTDFRPLIGESKYHALQINLQKRFSDGLSGTASYVWSKLMDTSGVGNGAAFLDPSSIQDIYNYRRGEYSLSTLDVPHRFVGSFSYELPFGKHRRFGKDFGPLANAFFGGYKLAGTAIWQKGTPILIVANGFSELTGFFASQNAVRRPNHVGANTFNTSDYRKNARSGTAVIDINAFATPAALTLGDGSRTYDDVRRDNYRNFDLSLTKVFGFNENRQKMEFRIEALNALNLVVFGTPGNNINSSNFGIVTSQGNRPRIVQLVGRFTF